MLLRAFIKPSKTFAATLGSTTARRMNSSLIGQLKTLDELNSAIKSEKLTFVDFYATWCGPCKAVSPILEKLAVEYPNVQFRKVDVDESDDLAMEYGVSAMPTFVLFKDDKPIGKIIGANVNAIQKALKQYA
ncbi:Trx3 protein [Saccharomycopsis crataegensis]|uniref:Trx3 protein n=1 Tax=Saccharomycopsis crataegensis TaxID=43959 RepID=A0AAV5QMF3_9ASCO|nr:Trx3 protein [Saccharomycopsis crataegensis]